MKAVRVHHMRAAFLGGTFVGAVFGASAAVAQGAAPGGVEEIVVTANKRTESVQEVASSVTAVSGESLTQGNVTNVMRLDALVPGLNMGSSGNDARPALRGVRTEAVSVTQDPAVSFYVDDVYRSRTSQAMAAFVDVDRAEVLRGPQGTLFGRNAFGGAVNIISKAPDASQFDYSASISYGRFNTLRTEDMVNLPLGSSTALRVAAMVEQGDDRIKNSFSKGDGFRDANEMYIRAKLRHDFNDAVRLDLSGSYWSDDGNGSGDFGYYAPGVPVDANNNPRAYGTFVRPTINTEALAFAPGGPTVSADKNPFKITRDFNPNQDVDEYSVRGSLSAELGFASLRAIGSYTDFSRRIRTDGDFSILPIAEDAEFDSAETTTQEVQLVSPDSTKFEWVLGAFLLQDRSRGNFIFDYLYAVDPATGLPDFAQPQPAKTNPNYFDYAGDAIVRTNSYALYGQASYYVTPAIRLTGGLRQTWDRKRFSGTDNYVAGGFLQDIPPVETFDPDQVFAASPRLRAADTFKKLTWLADATYFVSDDTMVYAKASTGFQSGGFNSSPSPVDGSFSFDPQTVHAYELGFKTSFADRRVRLNVAAFYNDYKDLLAQSFTQVGGVLVAVQDNAGAAKSKGVELELDAAPTESLRLSVRASYNDAKYGRFVVGGGDYPDTYVDRASVQTGTFTPVPAGTPNSVSLINLKGRQIQLNPKFTFSAGIANDFELGGDRGSITPSATIYYSSSYYTNDRNRPIDRQDGYARLDLGVRWTSADDRLTAEIFGQNITNERILTRSVDFPGFQPVQNFQDPAYYGVRFTIRR